MKIVIDTNILFSAMINRQSLIGDIILNSQNTFTFYGCESLFLEIQAHKEKILHVVSIDEDAFNELSTIFYTRIRMIQESSIPLSCWRTAANLVRDIDLDDVAFVSLAIHLNSNLWTGDKILYTGLIKKGFSHVISTAEISKLR